MRSTLDDIADLVVQVIMTGLSAVVAFAGVELWRRSALPYPISIVVGALIVICAVFTVVAGADLVRDVREMRRR